MNEIKEISTKISVLLFDILLFAYKVVTQLILPNKKRKGNILSSLFVFFVGTVKRISHFEHRSFRMAVVFNQKYVRHALFLIGAVLLLLSSFEWRNNEEAIAIEANRQIEQFQQTAAKSVNSNTPDYVVSYLKDSKYPAAISIFYGYKLPPSRKRIYLFSRSLRI